ncbi:MAG: UDP-N-acetylmuramate dehydrogenase [Halothiobacillaceae bacterium]|nr:UDP-N-acetylmuramate dehydrogenase [Halothiobacillaceae bacterium]
MLITENASLLAFNTFRVDARARYFVSLETLEDIPAFLADTRFQNLPRLILGGGSNILLREDFPGVVLHVALKGIELLGESETHRFLAVAAGENWHDLVRYTVEQGWAGLENLSLIPGTVGAAPVQNIGAYGVELAERCAAVDVVDMTTGEAGVMTAEDCRFAYRDSRFKREPGCYLITSVLLKLPKTFVPKLDYPGVREALGNAAITPHAVSNAICSVRQSKLPGLEADQPGSAGSFFQNPIISSEQAAILRELHPNMPAWDMADQQVKLSAAWLIEQCDWKGLRQGDAGVYEKHALVLVNHGQASGAAGWALAEQVMQSVQTRFVVALQPEPILVPAVEPSSHSSALTPSPSPACGRGG